MHKDLMSTQINYHESNVNFYKSKFKMLEIHENLTSNMILYFLKLCKKQFHLVVIINLLKINFNHKKYLIVKAILYHSFQIVMTFYYSFKNDFISSKIIE